MDSRIIAGRFIQCKVKGSNGKVAAHLADDPLSGDRVMVKVFADDSPVILEYLKSMNVLNDRGCRGMVLPLESGMLEEEPGYYQAFPEVHGPTLEEYSLLNPSMEAAELERLLRELEATLEDLHAAGFTHLFLSPRNIFYSPGRPVFTKDPALTYQNYSFFMQELEGFDYSFFSPRLMDGGEGGPEEDYYSLGRTVLAVMDRVELAGDEELGRSLRKKAAAMTGEDDAVLPSADEERSQTCEGAGEDEAATAPAPEAEAEREGLREESGAGEQGDRRRGGPDRLKTGLVCLTGDEGGAHVPGMEGAGAQRKWLRLLKAAAVALFVLCAGGLLAYGLPQKPDGSASSPGRETVTEEPGGGGEEPEMTEEGALPPDPSEEAAAAGEEVPAVQEAVSNGTAGTAGDQAGGSAAAAVAVEQPRANRRPVASFTASPCEGGSPLRVYLDGSSSYDPDGSIVSYQWSCGGGGPAVYRVFESNVIPSRISVVLTVTDDSGASSSAERVITLY